jgi:hypothetical protein
MRKKVPIQFLENLDTAFLAIFQRQRHLDKVPVPAQGRHLPKPIDPIPAQKSTHYDLF